MPLPRPPRSIAALAIAAAAAAAAAQGPALTPLESADGGIAPPWHVAGLPLQKKPFTRFSIVDVDGRRALRVEADSSYGNLVHPLRLLRPAAHLAWQWRVDDLIEGADLRRRRGDDTALKVCVFFDLPLARVPFFERQLLRMARTQSEEPLPAASVCYVWDTQLAPGTELDNAFTRRMRYIVLRNGPAAAHEWHSERRDVASDFRRLFGDESAEVPAIVGVGIGADADNTRSRSLGHVAGLVLEP